MWHHQGAGPPESLYWVQSTLSCSLFSLLWDDLRCRGWFWGFPACAEGGTLLGGWRAPPFLSFFCGLHPLMGAAILLGEREVKAAVRPVGSRPLTQGLAGPGQEKGAQWPPALLLPQLGVDPALLSPLLWREGEGGGLQAGARLGVLRGGMGFRGCLLGWVGLG